MQSLHVLLTPGVDGDFSYLEKNTSHWHEKHNLIPHYYSINFGRGSDPDEERKLYFQQIRETEAETLVAVSGSGLLALDALKHLPDQIRSVILICTRLRPGYFPPIPYFYTIIRYPSFFTYLRSHKKILADIDTDRVMSMYSSWDEIVPPSTAQIEGAINFQMKQKPKSWPFHNYFSHYGVKEYEQEIIQHIKKRASL